MNLTQAIRSFLIADSSRPIIIGLGNPGRQYELTRHNIGREIINSLAGPDWRQEASGRRLVQAGEIGGQPVIFVLPNDFMNRSGPAIKPFLSRSKLSSVIVVYDDMDLPWGKIKVSRNRNAGGHRGLKSIIDTAGSKDFVRLRIGISKPRVDQTGSDFVLTSFTPSESKLKPQLIANVHRALEKLVTIDLAKAIAEINQTN
jgi:peptidyl-tRNA hydrolase, PTH1 family